MMTNEVASEAGEATAEEERGICKTRPGGAASGAADGMATNLPY